MIETPEQDRLRERMERPIPHDGKVVRTIRLLPTWRPGAGAMTDEQRAASLNGAWDAVEAQDRDRLSVYRVDARAAYEGILEALQLATCSLADMVSEPPEMQRLRSAISGALDFAAIHAGQMLPKEDQQEISRRVRDDPPPSAGSAS